LRDAVSEQSERTRGSGERPRAGHPGPQRTRPDNQRIWTIPNVISVVRLLLVPVFLWLLFKPDAQPVAAGALLAFLGATDWVDGYIARHFDQGSELGKILDPLADRILLLAAIVALLIWDISWQVNLVLIIALVREIGIAIASVVLGIAGARRIDVVWAGKAGTLALMFALPLFIAGDEASGALSWFCSFAAWCFAIGGIVLGYYAAMKYIPAAREALREGRAAKEAVA
jgi:cardiolipin synthase